VLAGIGPLINLFGAAFWTGLADATRRHRLCHSPHQPGGGGAALPWYSHSRALLCALRARP
jgi:hypothetical protein